MFFSNPNQINYDDTFNYSSTQSSRIVQGIVDLIGIIISFVAFGLVYVLMVWQRLNRNLIEFVKDFFFLHDSISSRQRN